MVARINTIQRIHLLRHGMLSAKGHCFGYQVEPKIATTLPVHGSQHWGSSFCAVATHGSSCTN